MPASVRKKRARAATLADVGRAAGVSAMAASAVLNSARTSSRISPDTRARIVAAAQLLNYRPNAAARALLARRMNTIGVAAVVDAGELNTYFLEVFNGLLEAAAQHEQNTTVFTFHDWTHDVPARLPRFCDGRVDGLILIAPLVAMDVLRKIAGHTPYVTIHNDLAVPGVVNLESDEEAGAFTLVTHLIAQGHRRILHLTGNRGRRGSERRIAAYRRALEAAGIVYDPALVVDSSYSTPAGAQSMRTWLQQNPAAPLPDAVFCANDGIAVGVMEVLAEAGYSVPGDVSVAGFDDSLVARTASPQLTTVRQPLRAMGRQAVESLLLQIRAEHEHDSGMPATQTAIVFPTELIARASVAPRARAAAT